MAEFSAALTVCCCAVIIVYQIGKCLILAPKAGQIPRDTLHRYYDNCLINHESFGVIEISSYVCLINRERVSVGGWEGFKAKWKRINAEVLQLIEDHFPGRRVSSLAWNIQSVRIQKLNERIVFCTVVFAAEVTSGVTIWPHSTAVSLGPVYFQEECFLGMVGQRWYMLSHEWRGVFLGDSPG